MLILVDKQIQNLVKPIKEGYMEPIKEGYMQPYNTTTTNPRDREK
jgi:hypothetical protein